MNDTEAKELIDSLKTVKLLKKQNNLHGMDHIKSILQYGQIKEKKALITIIIPAFRRPESFKKALRTALSQKDFDDYEILITDDSEELSEEYLKIVRESGSDRIRYYKNEKALGWYNWNRLLELADSEWVCMLHDDDILNERHLYYLNEIRKKYNDAVMITCNRTFYKGLADEITMLEADFNSINIKQLQLKNLNFQFASFMLGALIRLDKANEIGGFNHKLISLDWEFIARMLKEGPVYSSPLASYGYGVNSNESMKSEMWEKMLINDYFISRSIAENRSVLLRALIHKCEDYTTACHAYEMSHPMRNIYGVELDGKKLCNQLGIHYSMKDKNIYRIFRKLLSGI